MEMLQTVYTHLEFYSPFSLRYSYVGTAPVMITRAGPWTRLLPRYLYDTPGETARL